MSQRERPKRRGTKNPRRDFSVKEQLLGKLGPGAYGRLLDQIRQATKDLD